MIKVLVINKEQSGVDLYRLNPNKYLNKQEFDVYFTPIVDHPPVDFYKELQQFDVVVFSRMLSNFTDKDWTSDIQTHLNKAKVKVVVDYDDSWNLPKYHRLSKEYEKKGYRIRQVKAARFADALTCSTPYLRDKLLSYNKDVTVVKNCVDYNEPQWMKFKAPSMNGKLRVGWIGAVDHKKDMQMIKEEFAKLSELDVELYYGGYAPQMENQEIAMLMSYNGKNKNFDVIPALDITCYGQMYNHIDVALAPLYKDDFTQSKSELKALEAGFMGCAFIGSNQVPYTYVCNERNSILVDGADGWYDAIKRLNENRDLITNYAEKLRKDVLEHYDIKREVEVREQLYKRLCQK